MFCDLSCDHVGLYTLSCTPVCAVYKGEVGGGEAPLFPLIKTTLCLCSNANHASMHKASPPYPPTIVCRGLNAVYATMCSHLCTCLPFVRQRLHLGLGGIHVFMQV
jgi:hypothetical protein